jgi:hypothetical protein
MSMSIPSGFVPTGGDGIHSSPSDGIPHLSGELDGRWGHLRYYGQTTLGMYERELGGLRVGDVEELHERFPNVFKASGLGGFFPKE